MRSSKCMKLPTPLTLPLHSTFPPVVIARRRCQLYTFIYIHIHIYTHTRTPAYTHTYCAGVLRPPPKTHIRVRPASSYHNAVRWPGRTTARGGLLFIYRYIRPLHMAVLCLTHRNPKLFCKITPLGLYFLRVFSPLRNRYYFNSILNFFSFRKHLYKTQNSVFCEWYNIILCITLQYLLHYNIVVKPYNKILYTDTLRYKCSLFINNVSANIKIF